jgi:membrane protease YdiL (CAAX protease family)
LVDVQRSTLIRPFLELLAVSVLLTSYIWMWGGTFRGAFPLCLAIYAAIGLAAHARARERASDIGLRMDNLRVAARDAVLATSLIGLVLVGAGAVLGSVDFPPLDLWPKTLWDGVIWGFIQQYGLLCIYYRRFNELLPNAGGAPPWVAGAVFALFHLPNPFLTIATFGAGMLSCWLYRRAPNLLVLGAMHGVVSFLIVRTLPETITMGMRVGPGFLTFVPGP